MSAGTFLAASAYPQARGVSYEGYPVTMLAIMETPAITIGLGLAQSARSSGAGQALAQGSMLKMLSGGAHPPSKRSRRRDLIATPGSRRSAPTVNVSVNF